MFNRLNYQFPNKFNSFSPKSIQWKRIAIISNKECNVYIQKSEQIAEKNRKK